MNTISKLSKNWGAVHHSDEVVLRHAVWLAGALGDRAMVPRLLPLLEGGDDEFKCIAAAVLSELAEPEEVRRLVAPLLETGTPKVCAKATVWWEAHKSEYSGE